MKHYLRLFLLLVVLAFAAPCFAGDVDTPTGRASPPSPPAVSTVQSIAHVILTVVLALLR